MFGKGVVTSCWPLIRGRKRSLVKPNAFEDDIINKRNKRLKEEYRGISDIINGLSYGKIHLGFGHESNYWTDDPSSVEIEAFAQLGRMYYENNPDVRRMLSSLFPSLESRFISMMSNIK